MLRQALLSCVLVSLGGCFASERDRYNVDDYWNELGTTHCQVMLACCTRAEYNDWWTTSDGDVFECEAAHQAPNNSGTIRQSISEGRILFDETAAHACVTALATIGCSTFEQAYRFRETYCESPLIGTVSDGAQCFANEECAGGHCNNSNRCAPLLAENAPCTVGVDQCQAPLRCSALAGGIDFTCNLGRPAGSACVEDDQCADAWCKSASDGTSTCLNACDG